jgi:hypothetical protein
VIPRAWLNSSGSRFSAIVLSVTLLFATYFTFLELDRAMDKGEIYALLFKRPRSERITGNSSQTWSEPASPWRPYSQFSASRRRV